MDLLHLQDLPDETYRALKQSAKRASRSMDQQAIYIIQNALAPSMNEEENQHRKNAAIEELKQLGNIDHYDQEQLIKWIREDRDR